MTSHIYITGWWKSRSESTEAITGRLARWLVSLAEIDPLFSRWTRGGMRHRSVVPQIMSLPFAAAELRDWIAENPVYAAREGRKHEVGYSVNAQTPRDNPSRSALWLNASCTQSPSWFANRFGITLFPSEAIAQNLIALARSVLLTSGLTWDCDWAGVEPGDYGDRKHRPGAPLSKFQSGWMVYLHQTFAVRLIEPQGVAIEGLANGGVLLTTVPNAVFDRRNRNHLSAAQSLQTALAPLNAEVLDARG